MADNVWLGGDGAGTEDWSVAANWSLGTVPDTNSEVHIDVRDTMYDITAGLDQTAAGQINEINIYQGYTGLIGTTTAYLQVNTAELNIGIPSGRPAEQGSGRIRIELQDAGSTEVHIHDTAAAPADAGHAPVILLSQAGSGNHDVSISGGIVGLATLEQGDRFTYTSVTITPEGPSTPHVTIGFGAESGAVFNMSRGVVHDQGAGNTTVNVRGGEFTSWNSGAYTNVNVYDGVFRHNSEGTITNLMVSGGGVFTSAADARAKTISNIDLYNGATLDLDTGNALSITATNHIDLQRCGLADVTLRLGKNLTIIPAVVV